MNGSHAKTCASTARLKGPALNSTYAKIGAMRARNQVSGVDRPVLDRREPRGPHVTALEVAGPSHHVQRRGNKRPSYVRWKDALDAAAPALRPAPT